MKLWETCSWGTKVRPIEVDRVSEHFFWRGKRREGLRSAYSNYWPSEEEALAHIESRLRRAVETAQLKLKIAEDELEQFLKGERK